MQERYLERGLRSKMLIKRPLVISDKGILVGFKEGEWKEIFEKC